MVVPEELYAQAESSFQQGDLPLAQQKAEAGYMRFMTARPELASKFRILQVQVMMGRGQYNPALIVINTSPSFAFASCEAATRKDLLEAFAYYNLGRGDETAAAMSEAERECPSPDPILAADLATRRGMVLDDWTDAEKDYRAALGLVRQQHDSFREAAALLNLSNATQKQERYDESIEWGLASLEISRRMGYRRYEEKAEGNLAWNYYKLGDFERSLQLFGKAEEVARRLDAGDDRIIWRNALGRVHEHAGQLIIAEADYHQALAMARQQQNANQTIIALLELSFVSIQTGAWEQAEKLSEEGGELAKREQNRPLELQAWLEQGLIASHRGDTKTAEGLLLRVARDPGQEYKSETWGAQAELANLYAKEQNLPAANSEYLFALNTVREARCSVHEEQLRLPFFSNATRIYNSYIDFLVEHGKIADALKTADESRALTLAEGLGVGGKKCLASETAFDPQRTAKNAKAIILFYWLGTEHSHLWAVAPDGVKHYPLPPAAQIDSAVEAYRKALTGSRDVLQSNDTNGETLYQTLVAPAGEFFRPDLRGRVRRVIVIAEGSLSGLNFETLIAPNPVPHYWIKDVCLEDASSLRLLGASTETHSKSSGRLLLIGDPVPPKGSDFTALPNAAKEIQSVRQFFPAASEDVYEQYRSTPTAYIGSHPEQFSYIHFVAHGVASLTDPLDSAVVLSPATDSGLAPPPGKDSKPDTVPGNDHGYKLYARDVMTRPLNAELVTVSTCKGAGVREYPGEGLVGLSWAFLHAGAHHVIGALWDVSDESTPLLMSAMYAELVKGSPPEEALRKAKLLLLGSGAPFRKPYYWAPFQLYTGS